MSKSAKTEKRYPLKHRPTHNPGESVQKEMDRVFEEELMSYVYMAVFAVVLAITQWLQWWFKQPPRPVESTIVAVLIIGFCVFRFVTTRRKYQSLRLGLEGEKYVGQFLETLRTQGCQVFHDIPGKGFNIDHVVISPHGILTIETKTYSKPVRGETVVQFDGTKILINGLSPDRDPLIQARASASWLRDHLFEWTGQRIPVRGVILFPDWYVTRPGQQSDIWVLNQNALPAFLQNEPVRLKTEDIALASSRIVNYMETIDD